jgi:signal peptidase I
MSREGWNMRVLREILVTLTIAMAMFIVLQLTIQSSVVVGRSMEPNLQNGQRLVVSKVAYIFHQPSRGDVIVFHPPISMRTEYIKRIIGLPGDTVEVKDGGVIVNGKLLQEPYIASPPLYTFPAQKVPENEYFVMGDNRNNSNDSHNWGGVSRQSIVGKGWLSIWPPADWGLIPNFLQAK